LTDSKVDIKRKSSDIDLTSSGADNSQNWYQNHSHHQQQLDPFNPHHGGLKSEGNNSFSLVDPKLKKNQ